MPLIPLAFWRNRPIKNELGSMVEIFRNPHGVTVYFQGVERGHWNNWRLPYQPLKMPSSPTHWNGAAFTTKPPPLFEVVVKIFPKNRRFCRKTTISSWPSVFFVGPFFFCFRQFSRHRNRWTQNEKLPGGGKPMAWRLCNSQSAVGGEVLEDSRLSFCQPLVSQLII